MTQGLLSDTFLETHVRVIPLTSLLSLCLSPLPSWSSPLSSLPPHCIPCSIPITSPLSLCLSLSWSSPLPSLLTAYPAPSLLPPPSLFASLSLSSPLPSLFTTFHMLLPYWHVPYTILCPPFLSLQKITRVKKIDEEEEEGGELTEEEIAALSRGE